MAPVPAPLLKDNNLLHAYNKQDPHPPPTSYSTPVLKENQRPQMYSSHDPQPLSLAKPRPEKVFPDRDSSDTSPYTDLTAKFYRIQQLTKAKKGKVVAAQQREASGTRGLEKSASFVNNVDGQSPSGAKPTPIPTPHALEYSNLNGTKIILPHDYECKIFEYISSGDMGAEIGKIISAIKATDKTVGRSELRKAVKEVEKRYFEVWQAVREFRDVCEGAVVNDGEGRDDGGGGGGGRY